MENFLFGGVIGFVIGVTVGIIVASELNLSFGISNSDDSTDEDDL